MLYRRSFELIRLCVTIKTIFNKKERIKRLIVFIKSFPSFFFPILAKKSKKKISFSFKFEKRHLCEKKKFPLWRKQAFPEAFDSILMMVDFKRLFLMWLPLNFSTGYFYTFIDSQIHVKYKQSIELCSFRSPRKNFQKDLSTSFKLLAYF